MLNEIESKIGWRQNRILKKRIKLLSTVLRDLIKMSSLEICSHNFCRLILNQFHMIDSQLFSWPN